MDVAWSFPEPAGLLPGGPTPGRVSAAALSLRTGQLHALALALALSRCASVTRGVPL